jgi:hypothetical protein
MIREGKGRAGDGKCLSSSSTLYLTLSLTHLMAVEHVPSPFTVQHTYGRKI